MKFINKPQSPTLNLLDEIYRDPFLSNIETACANYHAARRAEQYADIEEEIEDAIANIDINLIWDAVGPDAYDNHHAVGIQVRKLIAKEDWTKLGRLIGTGAKAYLRPFAADEVEATRND